MSKIINKPYVLRVAEIIYLEVFNLKKKNNLNNVEAFELFIGSDTYKKISSGKFHDEWLTNIKKNNFIDEKTGEQVSKQTIQLLEIQKDSMIKQLVQYPKLYYAKSHYPLEISQRAFNHLWRICESYELWCKETDQRKLIYLNLI
jgi:hypothetical protein|tara:strand:+ start:465 stop:899 length:435 start_codon:yes stop_codon:yes gene_type:complete